MMLDETLCYFHSGVFKHCIGPISAVSPIGTAMHV